MSKKCSECKQTLPIEKFSYKNKKLGAKQSVCKACHKKYSDSHYKRTKHKYKDSRAGRRDSYRAELKAFLDKKKDVPCVDCGHKHPPFAMDFHHVNKGDKNFSISMAVRHSMPMEKVKKELKKCVVLCALCHRYRTFGTKKKKQK
mgnify:CR=1 FL=1